MTQSATAVGEAHQLPVTRPPVLAATVIGSLEEIRPGSVLIKPGTAFPRDIPLAWRRIGEWNLVAGLSSSVLDRKLGRAGWHFFFMVPPVEAGGWGSSYQSAFRKALAGVVRQVETRDLNALEIADLHVWRLLNVHYVRLSAYARHVHNSPFLRDPDPRHRVDGLWNSLRIFEVRNRKVAQIKGI